MNDPGRLKIALDAMGGDHAPEREVAGAVEALRQSNGAFEVVLVGDEQTIRTELAKHSLAGLPHSVVHAPQVITMDDSPTASVKGKKESSLAVGVRLHQEGKVQAFASAGNTGAVLAASTLILGRIPGVSRPTIGTFFPSTKGVCLLLDAGTNVDCRPRHLYEFAVMGSIYFSLTRKKERPTVGLLNVGEERTKGTEVVLEAHALLEKSGLEFIGNVEGRDILRSKADVVVCDGFVGNIVLKFGESVPSFLKSRIMRYADQGLFNKVLAGIARFPLKSSLRDMDPNEYGGVPVLGVNGVSIIGHGSSSVKGIKNMVLCAADVAASGLTGRITAALAGSAAPQSEGKQ